MSRSRPWSIAERPRSLSAISDHPVIVDILRAGLAAEEPRHMVLVGPTGAGKTSLALAYARSILCAAPDNASEPCQRCEGCQAFEKGNHADFHRVDAELQGSTETIDQLVEDILAHRPMQSSTRVVLIDEAAGLERKAQKALLAALENPDFKWVALFTCLTRETLLTELRDRCRTYELSYPDPGRALVFVRSLAEAKGVAIDEEAATLISSYGRGYRQLTQYLEKAQDVAAAGRVTADLVREHILRDRSISVCDYLDALCTRDLTGQLSCLAAMGLEDDEKVAAVRDVLAFLVQDLSGSGRFSPDVATTGLLLPPLRRRQLRGQMTMLASQFDIDGKAMAAALLEYWLRAPALGRRNDARDLATVLAAKLSVGAASPPAFSWTSPLAAYAAGDGAAPTAKYPLRRKNGDDPRRSAYLNFDQAGEICRAASAALQLYGAPFNAMLRLGPDGTFQEEQQATKTCRSVLRGLDRRLSASGIPLHRISLLEEAANRFSSVIVFHLPNESEATVRHWLEKRFGGKAKLDVGYHRKSVGRRDRHWALIRALWAGCNPEIMIGELSLLDRLNVPPGQRRSLGQIKGRRFNIGHSLSTSALVAHRRAGMPVLSAWDDGAWDHLFSGWEIAEFKARGREYSRRDSRIAELLHAYEGADTISAVAGESAVRAEQATWSADPRDWDRPWTGWWEDRQS